MNDSTYKKYCQVIDQWFINGFNGTQAYLHIYPNAKPETAAVKFNELVRIGKIQEYKEKKHIESNTSTRINHENLLKQLDNWLFLDRTKFLRLSPSEVELLPLEMRQMVERTKCIEKTIETPTGEFTEKGDPIYSKVTTTEIQLWFPSKAKAFEMASKHIGFFGEHNYQKNTKLSKSERRRLLNDYKKRASVTPSK